MVEAFDVFDVFLLEELCRGHSRRESTCAMPEDP